MDNTLNQFNELLHSARDLPLYLRQRLVDILQKEISDEVPDLIVSDEEYDRWNSGRPRAGREIAETDRPPIYEHIADPPAWVRELRSQTRP